MENAVNYNGDGNNNYEDEGNSDIDDLGDYEDDLEMAGFGYFGGEPATPLQAINIGIGFTGLAANIFQNHLNGIKQSLQAKGTQTALSKINKFINPSITRVDKFSKTLGIIGAGLTVSTVAVNFFTGKDLTVGQAVDVGISIGLAVATISNPIALVGFGIYGLIDASGALNDVKSNLGFDKVILESSFK